MRISDWSSDVCSSDLAQDHPGGGQLLREAARGGARPEAVHPPAPAGDPDRGGERFFQDVSVGLGHIRRSAESLMQGGKPGHVTLSCSTAFASWWMLPRLARFRARSEEHTSELQSLMRISYAVFCLKKKKKRKKTERQKTQKQHNNTKLYN